MKTKILIFILLLCLAPTLHAVTYNSVKVYTPTGEPVYLSLNGAPVGGKDPATLKAIQDEVLREFYDYTGCSTLQG